MIYYGTKNKELAKEIVTDKCPHCGNINSIDMHVFQKYAHVFWIPVFPLSKTGIAQCDHCKKVFKLSEMPEKLLESYQNLKAQTKTPTWMFSGLALFAGIILLGIYNEKNTKAKNEKIILAPVVGDIYEVKTNQKNYTAYKVDQVLADSVYVLVNNFETNKRSGLKELKTKAYSTDEVLGFSKNELKQMLEKGDIIDIERK
jgi:hypothetical protein